MPKKPVKNNKNTAQEKSKLSLKHQKFIEEYLFCNNATKAYMNTYPDASYATALTKGPALVRNGRIKEELDKIYAEARANLPERLTTHLENLTFFNIGELLNENNEIDFDLIKNNKIPGIVSGVTIKQTKYGEELSFKLIDQTKAADLLSKITKIQDANNIVVNNKTELTIDESAKELLNLLADEKNKLTG